MQIAIFKQPWRIKVKGRLPEGVGHHYCPLRRSIPQPRDVNAIEQLRTAREATTIDSLRLSMRRLPARPYSY